MPPKLLAQSQQAVGSLRSQDSLSSEASIIGKAQLFSLNVIFAAKFMSVRARWPVSDTVVSVRILSLSAKNYILGIGAQKPVLWQPEVVMTLLHLLP